VFWAVVFARKFHDVLQEARTVHAKRLRFEAQHIYSLCAFRHLLPPQAGAVSHSRCSYICIIVRVCARIVWGVLVYSLSVLQAAAVSSTTWCMQPSAAWFELLWRGKWQDIIQILGHCLACSSSLVQHSQCGMPWKWAVCVVAGPCEGFTFASSSWPTVQA
jgi:hypothetical protein